MSDAEKDNKPGSQPVPEKDGRTSPLKFTDYSVGRFTSNFIGSNGKTRPKVFTPFGFKSGSLKEERSKRKIKHSTFLKINIKNE
jgi:hypothetical protein|tara:strand:- start:842 stop:1093 length:252 start_codon:yes stop_codon:yes gene_type:complete